MMPTPTKLLVAAVTTMALLIVASPAWAEDSVSVEVRAIAADSDGDHIDEELEDIESRLRRGFTDYSSFRHIERNRRDIERDDAAAFELPTDDLLTLTYRGHTDEFVQLGLELENRLSTSLRATPGSTFFQAGLTYGEGTLVLAITVE